MSSTGAMFTLISNDGKADRLVLATPLLLQRIKEIMHMRARQGKADITPTLLDIERTHILYINAHFKPYAAIGFEYNKVKPQASGVALGSSVTFSIPQFGDFIYDMVCRVRLGKSYAAQGSITSGATTIWPLNVAAAGTDVVTGTLYNVVDPFGVTLAKGSTSAVVLKYRNLVRYCEYPGHKLFSKVKFDVSGNPLDEYDQYVPVMLDKLTVCPNKRHGSDKLVGQQVPLKGYEGLMKASVFDTDNTVSTGATITGPGWRQASLNIKATTGNDQATYLSGVYNTPAGIDKFVTGQSNQTVGLFQPDTLSASAATYTSVDIFATTKKSVIANSAAAAAPTDLSAPVQAVLDAPTLETTQSGVIGTGVSPGAALSCVHDNQLYDVSQKLVDIVNGPQTPKPVQPPLEIWNKLKFWFCDDVRLSIPSVSIPFGQRFITIDLALSTALVYEAPTLYLETISFRNDVATIVTGLTVGGAGSLAVSGSAASAIGFTTGPPTLASVSVDTTLTVGSANSVSGTTGAGNEPRIIITGTDNAAVADGLYTSEIRTYTPIFASNGLGLAPTVDVIELYINNIFVNPEVHDIFIRRVGFALIRVYRQQKTTLTAATSEVLLSSLKWPVEYMFVGVQPAFNTKEVSTTAHFVTAGNINTWRDWHRFTRQIESWVDEQNIATTAIIGSMRERVEKTKYWLPVPTIDTVSLTTHGISLFDSFTDLFFNAYIPTQYGQSTITVPEDPGVLFINLALFPRTYQPSGHLNISRVRETYIKFVSSYCSSKTNCLAIIVAVCINFLITSDGSAVLRYST